MKKGVNKEKLEVFRSLLPHGSQLEIAKELGISVQAVSQFLKGKSKSEQIEIAILKKIAEVRERKLSLYKKAGLEFKNI